jgi:hypothetical protein
MKIALDIGTFQIFFKNSRKWCTTGINVTGGKFATDTAGVVDTGGKFATGVVDTGDKFAAGINGTDGNVTSGK